MHAIAAPQADGLVAAVEPGASRRLLDVGGGPATYTLAFVKAVPGLTATLFDLPAVIELARGNVAAAGLLDRVDLVAGDLRTDALPGGHDLAFVSAIIHMLGPDGNVALFRKVHDALVPGGRIVIRDHVMSPDRVAPRAGALFAVNMLVGTEEGGTFTLEEIASWLVEAGFERPRLMRGGERMDALVEAFPAVGGRPAVGQPAGATRPSCSTNRSGSEADRRIENPSVVGTYTTRSGAVR